MSTKRITAFFSLNQAGFWMSYCLSSSFAAVYLGALGYSNTELGGLLALGSVLGFLLGTGLSSFVDTFFFCSISRCAASLRLSAIRCCWRSRSQ